MTHRLFRYAPLVLSAAFVGCAVEPESIDPSASITPDLPAQTASAITSFTLAAPCTNTLGEVYVTPTLPAGGQRGDILRCAPDTSISASSVASRLVAAGVYSVPVTSGATTWRVSYRTTRNGGASAGSTARVFLPTAPRTGPTPVVVLAHGTAGLSDACAPSLTETYYDYFALPWVARGYAVIATDFSALGNQGTQGYRDARDTAYSTMDAARALRRLVSAGTFSTDVVMLGHSNGGSAVLASQALAGSYGVDGNLRAVVAFAPSFSVAANIDVMRYPTVPASWLGIYASAYAMQNYAFFANRYGESHGGDGFSPTGRAWIESMVTTQCITAMMSNPTWNYLTVGDIFSPAFRSAVIACYDNGQCAGAAGEYVAQVRANVLTSDPNGAPVLLVAGSYDQFIAPSEERCIIDKLQGDGVTTDVCLDATANHATVASNNAGLAIAWSEAALAGTPRPQCIYGAPALFGACVRGHSTN